MSRRKYGYIPPHRLVRHTQRSLRTPLSHKPSRPYVMIQRVENIMRKPRRGFVVFRRKRLAVRWGDLCWSPTGQTVGRQKLRYFCLSPTATRRKNKKSFREQKNTFQYVSVKKDKALARVNVRWLVTSSSLFCSIATPTGSSATSNAISISEHKTSHTCVCVREHAPPAGYSWSCSRANPIVCCRGSRSPATSLLPRSTSCWRRPRLEGPSLTEAAATRSPGRTLLPAKPRGSHDDMFHPPDSHVFSNFSDGVRT